MFKLFDKDITEERIEKVTNFVTIIHLCKKMGITPKEFRDFTSSEKIREATNFLLEAMKEENK